MSWDESQSFISKCKTRGREDGIFLFMESGRGNHYTQYLHGASSLFLLIQYRRVDIQVWKSDLTSDLYAKKCVFRGAVCLNQKCECVPCVLECKG